jgi:phospholipase/carboxylesterase
MTKKSLSLFHVTRHPLSIPDNKPDTSFPTILALHGRGSNERDPLGIAEFLPHKLFWVCPRAALMLGMNSYEWYRVKAAGRPEPAQLLSAIESIDHFINEIIEAYPVDPQKLFLLGFSQGSILSMSYTLTHPQRIAGVIAQSGYIPSLSGLHVNETDIKGKPFILTHGVGDTLIPVDWARASREILQKLDVQLDYHEFNMGHGITMDSLAAISAWIERQLQ